MLLNPHVTGIFSLGSAMRRDWEGEDNDEDNYDIVNNDDDNVNNDDDDDLFRWLLVNNRSCFQLQDETMAALLPPVGPHLLRHFTPASLEEIQCRQEVKGKKQTEVWKLWVKMSVTLLLYLMNRLAVVQLAIFLTSQESKKAPGQPATWRLGNLSPLSTENRALSYLTHHWRS